MRKSYIYSDLIRSISEKIKAKADQNVNNLGLNAQQGRMIGHIFENQDKGIIQKDLAETFQRKEASITSMLQGLEKKGYIERKVSSESERQKNIYVLPKGESLIQDFDEAFNDIERSITESLSDSEKEILLSLLTKINQNL